MTTYSFYRDTDMEETPSDVMLKNAKKNNRILIALLVLFLSVNILVTVWSYTNSLFVKEVDIYDMKLIGSQSLCPNEHLFFEYRMKARGAGVLTYDMTVWRETPPKTIVYSEDRRFILGDAVEQHLVESWQVPATYFNYETWEDEALPPGKYRRYFAVSSPTRDKVIDIESIEFEVRDGKECVT